GSSSVLFATPPCRRPIHVAAPARPDPRPGGHATTGLHHYSVADPSIRFTLDRPAPETNMQLHIRQPHINAMRTGYFAAKWELQTPGSDCQNAVKSGVAGLAPSVPSGTNQRRWSAPPCHTLISD